MLELIIYFGRGKRMKRKTVAIIQARMSSTRLPGKVLLDICGKPALEHVIDRVKRCTQIDEIVIATTQDEGDKVLVDKAKEFGVGFYTGDTFDVLSRYYNAAKKYEADIIVRITSDCPLIDPGLTDDIVLFYKEHDYDLVANLVNPDVSTRTYPNGLDTEVFSFKTLEDTFLKADQKYQREHVTIYMHETIENKYCYRNDIDYSDYRWTLDTKEDYELICSIYKNLYKDNMNFTWLDVIRFVQKNPEICTINGHIEYRTVRL